MHPSFARHIVFPLQERLKGKNTYKLLRELEQSQWKHPQDLERLQFERLRAQLTHAYLTVPYYRRVFDERGLPPEKIKDWSEFQQLPFLTRSILRDQFEELCSTKPVQGTQRMSTGGSTGQPVTVLVDSIRNSFIDAARLRVHRWFNADVGVNEIVLWGSPIEVTRQDRIRNLRDRLLNSHLLSAFDLGSAQLDEYTKALNRLRPVKIYGYSGALYLLAQYFEATKRMPPETIKVIFATAEPLFDFQRETIEKVFPAKVSCEYGARDAGLMANECPDGGFHVPVEGMIVEIADSNSDGIGEVFVTNLFSRAMPTIRYRTGDVGRLRSDKCLCGRGLQLLDRVEGRQTDFVKTPDGRVIHALGVIYALRERPEIAKFQAIQDKIDHVRVVVVLREKLEIIARQKIITDLRKVLGTGMEVDLEVVDSIAQTPSGKFRYVVSQV